MGGLYAPQLEGGAPLFTPMGPDALPVGGGAIYADQTGPGGGIFGAMDAAPGLLSGLFGTQTGPGGGVFGPMTGAASPISQCPCADEIALAILDSDAADGVTFRKTLIGMTGFLRANGYL